MGSISNLFGYVLNFIYELVKNYGLAIIIFSILLKLILLPLSINQQKTMKKTSKIQGKVKELQNKYKNDQNKLNQEMMELYKREKMNPFSGCLTAILQIVLLFAMFGLVRNPLTYMKKIDTTIINNYKTEMEQELGENTVSSTYPEISILKYVNNYKSQEDPLYINTNFLGLDLSNIPQENWQEPTVYIIPVLYVLTSIVSMKMTTNMTTNSNKKEIIEIENNNKEKENSPEDMTAQMNKSMSWFMPIMSVSISIIAPLGLALYWLVNNILMIIERLLLNKFLKSEEEEQNG
ncbi:MAG: YidC/Oxa1 family membrane protein insertase [Clostridia bacterium]|nr:YidC/Oxa1 family membrane protein insertase [Clostridia bacterium]